MSFYFSGGQRPTSSPTQGPLVDSVRQLTFTDSRGQTSGYSIWAAHIDPDEPVGMLVHLHGDGGYEYKNDPDSWYLTGPTGILTLAQARNMILVIPFTPDREVDEINAETWWEDIVPHVGWAMELTQSLLNTYSVDMGKLWFSGFSGGAEAISHQVIPHHLAELGAHAGGFVILGGGGPPYQVTSTVISSPLKARFPITWVAGENDRPEHAYDNYDGRGTAEAGEAAYRTYGWATDLVIVPGKQHLLVDGSQGLYGLYIGEAMDAAPVISYTPGTVTELYLGDRPCELYLGSVLIWPTIREVVQITLGTLYEARDQLQAALTARGLDYRTVEEIPFDIELVGTGSAAEMFRNYSSLTSAPALDTSQVTNMRWMFQNCSSLTYVQDMHTSTVTDMSYMFWYCEALTDGNVRLIGKHPNVNTTDMITGSGLTREPWDTVQITLGTDREAQTQFHAALSARGLDYTTITEIPFDIELVGSGSARDMFASCESLTSVPAMDTSQVTDMRSMFYGCAALTYVPDMDTAQVTQMGYMFYGCAALTDGNVLLIGKHPNVNTMSMIAGSGLTREPFDVIIEVHNVSLTNRSGSNTAHSLVTVSVPAGETWSVRVQGTMQSTFRTSQTYPQIRIGSSTSSGYGNNATVNYSGTITSTNRTIALVTRAASWSGNAGFTGTVTIEK